MYCWVKIDNYVDDIGLPNVSDAGHLIHNYIRETSALAKITLLVESCTGRSSTSLAQNFTLSKHLEIQRMILLLCSQSSYTEN